MDATPAYSHTVYPAKPVKNPHKAMLGFGICALLLAIIPAVIYWREASSPNALAFSAILGAAGVASLLASQYKPFRETIVNETYSLRLEGITRTNRRGQQLLRWDDIAEVYLNDSPAARALPEFQVVTVVTRLAERITLDNTIENHYVLGEQISENVTRHLLPRISQAFRQGYAVEFGEVGLSKAGIRYQDQHIGWEEVTACCNYDRAARANCFEVFRLPKAQDNNDLWCRVCLADIPNSALFRDLLSNMFQLRGGKHAS